MTVSPSQNPSSALDDYPVTRWLHVSLVLGIIFQQETVPMKVVDDE